MNTIPVRELTCEAFAPYGSYANLLRPEKAGTDPAPGGAFFRELAVLRLGHETNAAFSTLKVARRPPVIDVTEYHSLVGEGMLVVDGEVLMPVGPAGPAKEPPLEAFEAFRVPAGTILSLKPGVWHYEPFPVADPLVTVLIVLPERAYAFDVHLVQLPPERQLRISV